MRILAIDTANALCSVALLMETGRLVQQKDTLPSKQAEHLFPLVATLFEETGHHYTSLDALAVTIGPGSFTGIRIGMAAARGIALAAQLPVIGVTTLEAAAWLALQDNAYQKGQPIMAALDARRGQVYVQLFSEALTPLSDALLVEYGHVPACTPEGAFFLVGSGAVHIQAGSAIAPSRVIQPDAACAAQVAAIKYPSRNPLAVPQPFYIREPDAKPQVQGCRLAPLPSSENANTS